MIKYITLPDGQRYRWKDLVRLRKEQRQRRQETQVTLFDLREDSRPASQTTAAGRYSEPTLFKVD
jgi:hypothetical protein